MLRPPPVVPGRGGLLLWRPSPVPGRGDRFLLRPPLRAGPLLVRDPPTTQDKGGSPPLAETPPGPWGVSGAGESPTRTEAGMRMHWKELLADEGGPAPLHSARAGVSLQAAGAGGTWPRPLWSCQVRGAEAAELRRAAWSSGPPHSPTLRKVWSSWGRSGGCFSGGGGAALSSSAPGLPQGS